VHGTIRQRGHVFRPEPGRALFYADEEDLDPDLDLVLSVQVEPYTIRNEVAGMANQRRLDFWTDRRAANRRSRASSRSTGATVWRDRPCHPASLLRRMPLRPPGE